MRKAVKLFDNIIETIESTGDVLVMRMKDQVEGEFLITCYYTKVGKYAQLFNLRMSVFGQDEPSGYSTCIEIDDEVLYTFRYKELNKGYNPDLTLYAIKRLTESKKAGLEFDAIASYYHSKLGTGNITNEQIDFVSNLNNIFKVERRGNLIDDLLDK